MTSDAGKSASSAPRPRGLMSTLMGRTVPALAVLALAGVAGLYGLERVRTGAQREIYRERLRELTGRYTELRDLYNAAVQRTALTELVVQEGRVSVRVRTLDGQERVVETPYDASREIYVDYAVARGRVWIRRVFDAATPPEKAVVIDPALASVDWDLAGYDVGKAVYRSLADGRWVVSVTGNGSLGLVKLEEGQASPELAAAPAVLEFEKVEAEVRAEVEKIGWGELIRRAVGG
jgi:hypothetical protein